MERSGSDSSIAICRLAEPTVEDQTREMHKMHMQGATIGEIACKYDLTYNIVRNRFAHRKLQINRKNKRAKK
jgi:hypothetical protein